MTDIGTILGHVSPREVTVRVCVDGQAAAEVDRAIEVSRSTRRAGTDADEAQAAVDVARERAAAATFPFTFRAISAKERSDLIAAHPGTSDEAWNVETLPPALVAVSCADPEMSPEQAAELMNRLPEGDRAALFNAAWSVNYDRSPVPFL